MTRRKEAHDLVAGAWGTNVERRRKALGLTQTALAERVGCHQSTVSEVESGSYRALTPALLLRFSVALDQEPADLFPWPFGVGEIARYNAETSAA